MSSDMSPVPPTPEECFANAARVLATAEMTLDRELISRYDDIARSYIALGGVIHEVREAAKL